MPESRERPLVRWLDECRKHGLKLCLYDEGGWPSGGACGKVWASDPAKFTRQFIVSNGPGKVKVEYESIDPQRAPLPDMLHPDAVKKFIEFTHEEYFRRFPDDFGTVIKFAFMDEPGYIPGTLTRIPWCADFAEEFTARKNYDILPYLPDILALHMDPATVRARLDYYDVLSAASKSSISGWSYSTQLSPALCSSGRYWVCFWGCARLATPPASRIIPISSRAV